jgi:hypothetical protein
MDINPNNYEAYFLDYIEGRLDSQSIAQLKSFLYKHPKLNIKTKRFDYLSPENINFPNKTSLKKFQFQNFEINDKNFDEFCIARLEKLLSAEKSKELFEYIDKYPNSNEDFDRIARTFLQPQPVTFDKELLYKIHSKRSSKSAILWYSIAAGLAIFVTVGINLIRQKNNSNAYSLVTSSKVYIPLSSKVLNYDKPQKVDQNKNLYKTLNINPVVEPYVINTLSKDSLKREMPTYLKPIKITMIKIDNSTYIQLNLNKRLDQINIQNKRKNNFIASIASFTKRITNIDRLKNASGKISIIKVAQAGINGINQITNSKMKLIEKTDTTGNVTALSFESGVFEYYRSNKN